MPGKKNYHIWIPFSLLACAIVFLAYTTFYFYGKANTLPKTPDETREDGKDEKIIREVGALMILPENETPTVATVSDPELLADHPFFSQAQKGDKTLIYRLSGKLILYRPEAGKIVDAGVLK